MKKLLSIILMASMIVTLTPIACGGALTQSTAWADPTITWTETLDTQDSSKIKTAEVNNESGLKAALEDVKNDEVDTTWVIKMTGNIELTATLNITKKVTLDLNGHVLSLAETSTGSVIRDYTRNANLTINDSNETSEHKFVVTDVTENNVTYKGLWVWNKDAEEISVTEYKTVYGGVITGGNNCNGSGYGGGISVEQGATLTLNKGNIVGCKANHAGAIAVPKDGNSNPGQSQVIMNGGMIAGCAARGDSYSYIGVVFVEEKNFFDMCGGIIKDCYTPDENYACDIYVTKGTFKVSGDSEIKSFRSNGKSKLISCDRYNPGNTEISGGTIDGPISIVGTITGGTFNGVVENRGTIYTSRITLGQDAKITTADGFNEVKYCVDGKEYAGQAVKSGGKATAPTTPTKAGYTFDGWYKEAECENVYNFENAVSVNTTLYSKWTPKTYTIKFTDNADSHLNEITGMAWTDTIMEKIKGISASKSGYHLTSWKCGDKNITSDTTYGDLVSDDTVKEVTLTAQWKENSVSYSSTQHPTVAETTNGTVTLSSNGRSATITPDAGYEIASITVNGEDKGAVSTLTGLRTGDKIEAIFQKTKETLDAETKAAVASLSTMKARSSKTAKGNIKVVAKLSTADNQTLAQLTSQGYTVKYKFYRSTKKSSGYKPMLEKQSMTYTNTTGQTGTRYYYKARVMVYDADGKLVASTVLKDCKYATRVR